jgi:capsular exopolysaccharide synthesis family protein
MSSFDAHEMRLRDYWRALLRRRLFVIVGVVCAVGPAVALSLIQPPVYEAQARMLLQGLPSDSVFTDTTAKNSKFVPNEIEVLEGQVVYERLKKDLALTQDPPQVTGSQVGDTDVVTVTVRSGDPDTAAILANAYVDAYINSTRSQAIQGMIAASQELQSKITDLQEQIDKLDKQITASNVDDDTTAQSQRRILVDQQALFKQKIDQLQVDAALFSGGAQFVRPATVPVGPVEPTPVRTAMLATLIGLMLGLITALLVDYADDTVRTADDLTNMIRGRPVLAVVPSEHPPDGGPIALQHPDSLVVESYRTLRTSVQFLGLDQPMQVIEVTSAVPGEGQTTTAANLAVVLAQAGHSVVLVDADLRRPRIHEIFSLRDSLGLVNVLAGEPIELIVRQVADQFSVIVAGTIPPNPNEMLSSARMGVLISELRGHFDFVIIDSPPTLPVSDAMALSRHVDGVLVIAQAGRTTFPQVQQTLQNLEQVSAPILGFVLNRAKGKKKREYGYGYNYGKEAVLPAPPPTPEEPLLAKRAKASRK